MKPFAIIVPLLSVVIATTMSSVTVAQRVSHIIAERGKAIEGCRLTNMSVGAEWDSPVDSSLPTYVITHGYNPLPGLFHLTTPEAYARKICSRYGDEVNVLAYHWDSRGQGSPEGNTENATHFGRCLGQALLERGVDPKQTTMIGHSMGSVVVSSAANYIFNQSEQCTHELVLIDGPKRRLPIILGELNATRCATEVKNVWASGFSGVGELVSDPRVTNIQAPRRRRKMGCRGPLCVARNNHMDVVLWYYQNYL